MADNLTPITSDQLPKVTTAQDTDLVTLGINGNFVSMTLANLKEVLGINALNTNTDMSGANIGSVVPFFVNNNFVGCSQIPFPNADKYNIQIITVSAFGGEESASFSWGVIKTKTGFHLQSSNADAVYYFGTLYTNKLWHVVFNASAI